MSSLITLVLATTANPPARVPDGGSAGLLIGVSILGLGLMARMLKNRKK